MQQQAKDRLTGAIILVALVVLFVPELLSGPARPPVQAVAAPDQAPLRSYTLELNDEAQRGSAPVAASTAADATQQASVPGGAAEAARVAAGVTATLPPAAGQRGAAGQQGDAGQATTAPQVGPGAAPSQPGAGLSARSAAQAPSPPGTEAGRPAPQHAGAAAAGHAAQREAATRTAQQQAHAAAARAAQPEPREATTARAAQQNAHAAAAGHAAQRAAGHGPAGWAVQLGSFGSRDNAQRLAATLQRKGFAATVSASTTKSGHELYRVRVGSAHDRTAAQQLLARLRAAGERNGEIVAPP